MRKHLPIVSISFFLASLTLLPYALAYLHAQDMQFTGFLFNPFDGASYLAKMREGWEGAWLYRLPFTDLAGDGAFLFVYYLFLGHLARWLALPLMAVFQIARVFGDAVFLIVAFRFFQKLGLSSRGAWIAWTMLVFGSGFGWLAILFGGKTADLWVVEFIPFLALLFSAHFPVAMALQMGLVSEIFLSSSTGFFRLARIFLFSILLALLQPFGVLVIGLMGIVYLLAFRVFVGSFPKGLFPALCTAALGTAPFALYDFWVSQTNPLFASWAAQNQTPTPPVWDVALSLGLPGILCIAIFTLWLARRNPWKNILADENRARWILGFWSFLNLLALFAPFALQRRLMLGMMIPFVALAAPLMERFLHHADWLRMRIALLALILPLSNFVVLGVVVRGILVRDEAYYLSREESATVDWLQTHASPEDVVIAPPDLARWLPGMAGVRVVYGHPMETPFAEAALADLNRFYCAGSVDSALMVAQAHHARWAVWVKGAQDCLPIELPGTAVFRAGRIAILSLFQLI